MVWRDRDGASDALEADHVVCTIPLPVLRAIPADFSAAVKQAIARGAENYVPAVKVAFAAQERWWEAREQIYGGISWTAHDITQLWYPSHGFHNAGGILLGAMGVQKFRHLDSGIPFCTLKKKRRKDPPV